MNFIEMRYFATRAYFIKYFPLGNSNFDMAQIRIRVEYLLLLYYHHHMTEPAHATR